MIDLDRFNDKLQVLENKLNDIELSRTQRKINDTDRVSTFRQPPVPPNNRPAYQGPTASTGEHGTKLNYSKYDHFMNRDYSNNLRSRTSHLADSPTNRQSNKYELKSNYRKSNHSMQRNNTGEE